MTELTIDLNADLGESPTRLTDGSDAELMRFITSANIACGAHAGDAATIKATLELARQNHVAAGAHPSYPDRENFGRIAIDIPIADLEASIFGQISGFVAIAKQLEVAVVHVKPHGALYHSCNTDPAIAQAVARTVLAIDKQMVVVAQANAPCIPIYRDMGLRVAQEAFADRAYESDGTLRNRKLAGALLEGPGEASSQAIRIATNHTILSFDQVLLTGITADTLCIHSDTPGSASIARALRRSLEDAGVRVKPLTSR